MRRLRRFPIPRAAARLAGLLTLLTVAASSGHAQTPAAGAPSAPVAVLATPPTTVTPVTSGLVVPAGARLVEDVVVLHGPVDVYGTVRGDVMTLSGDIIVHRGGNVSGDATSAFGQVRVLDGGIVAGTATSMRGTDDGKEAPGIAPVRTTREDTWHALKLVLGWLTVLLIIGFGVLVTASPYLDGVAETLEVSFTRALGVGLVGQMLVLPALLALVVALALTVVGVLAIPLAIVAFVFAAAGLVTLGFLAVAFVTGRSIFRGERGPTRQRATSARGEALRAITVGVVVYLSLWVAAAAFTSVPSVAIVLRTVALAATWVAATAGFGAALASRAGTRSQSGDRPGAFDRGDRQSAPASPYQSSVPGWQTPTPVHGVVAARRPTSTTSATPSTRE